MAAAPVISASLFLLSSSVAPAINAFVPIAATAVPKSRQVVASSTWGIVDFRRSAGREHLAMASSAGEVSTVPVEDSDEDPLLSSMPWGDFQSWALKDNLPRYVVTIPALGGANADDQNGYETYALWRSLIRDVTELSGYDPRFLMKMHARELEMVVANDGKTTSSATEKGGEKEGSGDPLRSTPGVLPLLDQFEFTTEGGVSGRAYGLPGIADGAMVTTSAVADVESTVPRGFVRTVDGMVAYELGIPAGDFYSLDGSAGVVTEKARKAILEAVARTAGTIAKGDVATGAGLAKTVGGDEADAMMMNLAGSTAILLAGATAMSMLSHHLTVNVFWV